MENSSIAVKSVVLKAMANAKRLEILAHLHKEELSVGALEKLVGLSQSALSQHLAVLRKAGVVKTRRYTQTIYYSMENTLVENILKLLDL